MKVLSMHPVDRQLVTIGMPVFNGERFIEQALQALLNQSFKHISLIISDNASTDHTREICEAHVARDARVRYLRQPNNIGAMANFQFVLDKAESEYFMWAACDDIWDLDWIDKLLAVLQADDTAIAAYGCLQHIGLRGEPLKHPANGKLFPYGRTQLFRRLKYFLQFEGNGKANPIYAIFKRKQLAGLRVQEYPFDYLVVFELLRRGSFCVERSVALYKRIHESSEGAVVESPTKKGVRALVSQPVPWLLVRGYLKEADPVERILMILALPLKLLFAVFFRMSRYISRIFP